jgi:hypothetical protein
MNREELIRECYDWQMNTVLYGRWAGYLEKLKKGAMILNGRIVLQVRERNGYSMVLQE